MPLTSELVTRLLGNSPEELLPPERVVRTLVLLDQAVQGFESFEDYFRGGGTAQAALDALTAIGAAATTHAALRSAFVRMGAFDSAQLDAALELYDEAALLVMRESCGVYLRVVSDVGLALNRYANAHGLA